MPIGTHESTEKHLLDLAAKGNKNAFGLLYERYLDEIYRFVYFSIRDRWKAEELTQRVFIKSWDHLPIIYASVDCVDNFKNWLRQIARELVVEFMKSRPELKLETGNGSNEQTHGIILTDNELTNCLTKAIMRLEPNLRQVIALLFINQISQSEAAQIMHLGYNNISTLQHQALSKLQRILLEENC
jgi:RNA polymerase sigma-70 factor (ECF subfamily)